MDGVFMFGDLFDEADLIRMIQHPLFLLGADSMSSRLDGPMFELTAHNPISFAGHVHFLIRYAQQLVALPMETMVWKLTGMAADRFGIADRGHLRAGAYADVLVIRPDWLVERLDPPSYPSGVEEVLVNGTRVIAGGQSTGARPGRTLRPN
jgi:N-acyl-D-aspartate/D-glutamate deacylase